MKEAPQTSPVVQTVESTPDLSICIVNWNTCELVTQCLDSIFHTDQQITFEVIIVDNNSQDNSAEVIAQNYPQVRLIRNEDNRGFGRANNQALQISRGHYCLLLNSDTLMHDHTLDALNDFMNTHTDAGVVTGKVFTSASGEEILPSHAPTFPTPWILFFNDLISLTGLRKFFPNSKFLQRFMWTGWGDPDQEQEVANVTGAFMCVRRAAIQTVGLLDEAFFMYMEETDWCYRFSQAGWKIYYTPSASIVHFCEGSSRLRNDRDKLYYKSICYFFNKHYGKSGLRIYQLQELLLLRWLRRLHRLWHRIRVHPVR